MITFVRVTRGPGKGDIGYVRGALQSHPQVTKRQVHFPQSHWPADFRERQIANLEEITHDVARAMLPAHVFAKAIDGSV